MKRFLFINPFGIGDVLFTTAVIKAVKDSFPEAFIGYWCNERVADILKKNKRIDRSFALSRGDLKKIYQRAKLEGIGRFLGLLRRIKKEKFDIAFDFSLDHRYSLIAKLLGIKRRIGFNYKKRGRFLTERIEIDGYHDKHVVQYYLDLLKFIGIDTEESNLEINITSEDLLRAERLLLSLGISQTDLVIGIAPGAGASWGARAYLKRWPAEKFARLADKLINELKAKILILGDNSERGIADLILNLMKNKPLDLVGKTSLEELVLITRELNLLITNDGGPLHIAVAVGTKTISIFGPVDERVYGPYPADGGHIVIKKDLPCRPCYQHFKMPLCQRPSLRECIESITTEEVFVAAKKLL